MIHNYIFKLHNIEYSTILLLGEEDGFLCLFIGVINIQLGRIELLKCIVFNFHVACCTSVPTVLDVRTNFQKWWSDGIYYFAKYQ